MKHRSSRELFAYWTACRGARLAPERGDIDPGAIRGALADCFIVERDGGATLDFRLAGTRICAIFGRELKGAAFASLWAADSRRDFGRMAGVVAEEAAAVVAGVSAEVADHPTLNLELLLLPLTHRGSLGARMIGVLAPIEQPYWLGTVPVRELRLATHRHVGPPVDDIALPSLVPAPTDGRPRKGLVIYDGGRT